MAKLNLTFCCLQEVKYRGSGSKLIVLDSGEKYQYYWCGMKKKREAGVGILIKCAKDIDVDGPTYQDPRIMCFNLKLHGFNIRLVNGYAPTETGGSNTQKDEFYRSINKMCEKKEKHQKLIVVGDFNATTALALQKSEYDGSQILSDEICNDNGGRLKGLCRNKRLCISSTFFEYPIENRWTWYSCDKHTKKKNDYVLAEKFVQTYITSCKAEPDVDFDSDHKILITELTTPKTRRARWKKRSVKRCQKTDVKMLQDPEIRVKFKRCLTDTLKSTSISSESIDKKSDEIVKMLKSIGETTLPKVQKQNINETWKLDTELNELLCQRMETNMRTTQYKELTKCIKKRVKQLKNDRLREEAEKINEYANKRKIEQLFKEIKSKNSAFKELRSTSTCDPDKLKKHFEHHFNTNLDKTIPLELHEADFINTLKEIPSDSINVEPPTSEEIKETIKQLKQGKSASDIPTEYIKAAIENPLFLKEITQLYQTVWNTSMIPKSWGHSNLVAIWKGASKGKKTDEKAYRGLQIGSSLCKVLIVIIIKRIQKWYDLQLTDNQQGFRSGRGTTDGIYIAKKIHQITDQKKSLVYALFVDLTAAFDHIPREMMFETIKKRLPDSNSKKLITLLETLYSSTTTALIETPDNKFETKSGVRQGGPESPLLFNLYVDFIMRIFLTLCKKSAIHFHKVKYRIPLSAARRNSETVGYQQIDWIGYADDLILVFDSKKDLQQALTILDTLFVKFGLAINVSKTKTMILNHQNANNQYPETICSLNGANIDNEKTFIYLGSCLKYDEPSTGSAEIELRIDIAETTLYQYAKKLFNQKISLKTRVKIMNSIVRSRLVYGCQTWSLTQQLLKRLKSVYNGFLRKMTKGGYRRKKDSWSFILSNDDILRLSGTEDIESFIRKQQRNYLAHLVRHDDESMSKRLVFEENPKRAGRHVTMEKMVYENEKVSRDTFNRLAVERRY